MGGRVPWVGALHVADQPLEVRGVAYVANELFRHQVCGAQSAPAVRRAWVGPFRRRRRPCGCGTLTHLAFTHHSRVAGFARRPRWLRPAHGLALAPRRAESARSSTAASPSRVHQSTSDRARMLARMSVSSGACACVCSLRPPPVPPALMPRTAVPAEGMQHQHQHHAPDACFNPPAHTGAGLPRAQGHAHACIRPPRCTLCSPRPSRSPDARVHDPPFRPAHRCWATTCPRARPCGSRCTRPPTRPSTSPAPTSSAPSGGWAPRGPTARRPTPGTARRTGTG